MKKYLAAFFIIVILGCGQSESNRDGGVGSQGSSSADSVNDNSQKDWTAVLHEALAGATRLHVRSGGTCHRNREAEKTLLDVRDAAIVTDVIQEITIDSSGSGFHCMCCGHPTLEFYRGDVLVASLGYHHGRSVRWLNGKWEGDGLLTDKAAEFLTSWMHERGISDPKEEYVQGLRRRAKTKAAHAKWFAAMPSSLKPFWDEEGFLLDSYDIQKMNTAISEQFPDKKERIRVLLQWHGSGEESYWGDGQLDETAEELLLLNKTPEILSAIRDVELTPEQTEGAWRLFEDSLFKLDRSEDYDRLPDRLKQILQEHGKKREQE